MKDIVTFETSVRLREAGFPQPTPEAGQWWHDPADGPYFVGRRSFIDGRDRNIFHPETGKSFDKPEADFSGCVFAPTATDILRMMMDYELLSFATQEPVLFIDTITDVQALAAMWLGANEPLGAKIKHASETWKDTNTDEFIKKIRE